MIDTLSLQMVYLTCSFKVSPMNGKLAVESKMGSQGSALVSKIKVRWTIQPSNSASVVKLGWVVCHLSGNSIKASPQLQLNKSTEGKRCF